MEARLKEIQISRTDEKKNKETLQQMPRIVAKLEEKLKQREDEMKQMGTTIQELSTVNQSIGKKLKDTVKQMETGYKEREDRIAELEEFINDQVTELDKMEAALKQTVANKETLEKEFNELNEEMNRRYLQASAAEQVSADKDAKMQQMEKKVQRVFDEKAKVQEELNTTKEHLIFYKKEVQRLSEIQFNQQHPPPPVRSEQPSYGQAEHYVSEGINEEIRHQADFQRQQNQQDLEFTSHLAPDPFLICPNCKRQFREGQLPEYRRHIDNCRL
ncbi:golgin subfamily A member 6-like protein 22 isoform X2 [Dysidea avara]|uniref:golgin subfamily A member 6-like protein 22 isoform X2 n=1 Tax=Dysidea avara TaxID=196820 RepID=UPI003316C7BF